MDEIIGAADRFDARVKRAPGFSAEVGVKGRWSVECRDKHGDLKWTDVIENLVTNEGLNYLLTAGLADTGSPAAQITSWFIGLTDGTPTAAAGDTLASHSGWTEVSAYDESGRQGWTAGSVSSQSVSNSSSATTFTISTDSTTVGGAFLASVSSGTSGKLYAVGAFSGGDKALSDGDTLSVTATFTTAAA